MLENNKTKLNENADISMKHTTSTNPISSDAALLSYYKDSSKYNEKEIFDRFYSQALELMCGDKLIKPASSINNVTIRKTTTKGLYKLITSTPDMKTKIDYIDEGKLLNNRSYCSGTISKINEDEYELTYFDGDDEITIEYFNKEQVIDFMNKNKLIFQT